MNRFSLAALLSLAGFTLGAASREWTPKETFGAVPALCVTTGCERLNAHLSRVDVFAPPASSCDVGRLRARWKVSGDRLSVARAILGMNREQRSSGYSDAAVCRHLFEMNAVLGLVVEKAEFAAHMSTEEIPLPVDQEYLKAVGIVPDPDSLCYAGFRAVLAAPRPDPSVRFSNAVLDTLAGRFTSSWRYDSDGAFVWDLEIPDDVEIARVRLPGESVPRRVKPGKHRFKVSAGLSDAGVLDSVQTDVSALKPENRFVAGLLADRIRERVPSVSVGKGGLCVRFVPDSSLRGEEAVVSVKGREAVVRAGRMRAFVYGVGVLLRSLRYGPDGFRACAGEARFSPRKPVRMAYFANHFLNYYMEASREDLLRYVDDVVLDGVNALQLFHSMPAVDAAREGAAANAAFLAKSLAVIDRLAALDVDVGTEGGFNQLPADSPQEFRAVPNTDMHRGNLGFNACPSNPEALAAIRRFWGASLDPLEGRKVTYLRYWSFDEGGCECDRCSPYGENALLRLMDILRRDHAPRFPDAKSVLSTWMFHESDFAALWKRIEKLDDIDYIIVDHTGEYPRWPLDNPLPAGCKAKILTFPEISMWGRRPWGGYGAIAFPKRLHRLFKTSEPVSSGCHYYSEGIYEDINKWFVTSLYVDPDASPDDVLAQYASYHFPGTDPLDFVRLADLMEDNHVVKEMTVGRADEMVALVRRMDAAILPSMRASWRWRHVFLRALIDREIIREGRADPEAATPWFEEIVDIYRVRRQLELWRSGYTPCGWTTPHFGATKRSRK